MIFKDFFYKFETSKIIAALLYTKLDNDINLLTKQKHFETLCHRFGNKVTAENEMCIMATNTNLHSAVTT